MSPTLSEQRRAAVILAINALVPFLVLINVINWSKEAIAASSVVVTTLVTAFFLFLPNKTEEPVVPPAGP